MKILQVTTRTTTCVWELKKKKRRESAAALGASGLLEAEKEVPTDQRLLRILLLKERLNPSGIQQKEFRSVEAERQT
jgi:hypothetical protein